MSPRIAYCSVPKDGGTYTFYHGLRRELAGSGFELLCVTVGRHQASLWDESFADDGCVVLAPDEDDLEKQTRAFVEFLESSGIDIYLPMNSVPALSAVPHVPPEIKLVIRCSDMREPAFKIVEANAGHAHRIVATTPFQQQRLVQDFSLPPGKIILIPHGIDTDLFSPGARPDSGDLLRLIFLGRLEDYSKGVSFLAPIIRRVEREGIPFRFDIIGEGVHRPRLERSFSSQVSSGRVRFHGRLGRVEAARALSEAHVYLFPSRHEGFGFTLIEAMACGCVPVASFLPGVTDFITDSGKAAVLCSPGDTDAFARGIIDLYRAPGRLKEMSKSAREITVSRFGLKKFGESYAAVFERVLGEAPLPLPTRDFSEFRICPPCAPTWKSRIPEPVKAPLRKIIGLMRTAGKTPAKPDEGVKT